MMNVKHDVRNSIFSPESETAPRNSNGQPVMSPGAQRAIQSLDNTVMRCGRVLASQV
jgi:hypothetical protein